MKKITLILFAFAFLFFLKSNAQVSTYSFTQSNGTYSDFIDGTVLGTATGNAIGTPSLDNEVYAVTLPFPFLFNGSSYSSCNVSSNGFITFGTTAPATSLYSPISGTTAYNGSISAWGGDLNALFQLGGLTGDIRWKEIGTAPNREFVVQYKNFRPAYTTSTTLAPYLNFQIRLSETTNQVNIIYGNTGIAVGTTNSSTTKQIGLRGSTNTDFNNRTNATTVLFTASAAGTLNSNSQAYSSVNVTPGVPSNGLKYTWTPATCFAPSSLVVSNITTTDATISWAAPAIVPSAGYEYYYSTSNVAPTGAGTGTSNLTEIITPLSSGTDYYVWLRSNCGSGDFSAWTGPVTFRTVCAAFTVPSLENFTTYVPNCWQEADNGDNTAGPATFGASTWIVDGFGNVGTTGAARYNISTNTANDWLLSPLYTIPAAGYQLTFDAAATQTGSVNVPTTAWEADDFVQVLVSTGTTNWTVLYTYNDTNVPLNTGSTNFINLDAYAGQDVRFAFKVFEGTANGAASIDFSIDNFEVRLTPSCVEPTSLVANNVTYAAADLVWGAIPGSVNYEYILDNVPTAPAGSGTSTMATNFSAISLSPLTAYYFHVRNNCGAGFSTWSTISFTTLDTPPVNDNCSGAIALTVNGDYNCGTVTAGTVYAATASSVDAAACAGTEDDDVWFSFVATNTTHRISLLSIAGSTTDMYHSLWTGVDCNSLALVTGSCSDPNISNPTGLIVGNTYYIRVNTYTATGGQNSTFTICIGTPPPPPANDECSGAIGLTVNADLACAIVTPGTITSATASTVDAAACAGTEDDDVWFSFVATQTSHRILLSNVVGSTTDMYHSVWTGADCNSLTLVAGSCSDPNTSTPSGLTIGNTYYVRVNTYTATAGQNANFDICIGTLPPPPANDDASGAIALTVNADLACAVTTNGTTVSATASTDVAPSCSATGINDDVWYTFTAAETRHRFVYSGVTTGTMATALYTGTPGSLVELPGACLSGATQTFNGLTVGTIYYARVYTTVATVTTVTNFTVCVGTLPPPPVNDDCANAINVSSLPYTFTQDATSASNNSGFIAACDTGMNDGVWYSFEVGTTGNVTIAVTGVTGWDPEIGVYPSCGAFTCVGFINAGGSGVAETLNLTGLAPGQYRINIGQSSDTVDNSEGPLTINITGTAVLGTNSFDNSNFSYYPNPVKNMLNLSYTENISDVVVYNLLGQQVIAKAINANQSQIDMSHLSPGTYVVQVTANDQVKMIKVIKE